LFFWKINDSNNQTADEVFGGISDGELGTGFFGPNFGSKINLKNIGRLSSTFKNLGRDYPPNPKVYPSKFFPAEVWLAHT